MLRACHGHIFFHWLACAATPVDVPLLTCLPPSPYTACVTLIRSFSDEFKTRLLRVAAAVVYTPVNEHFGIVPIEAGASKRAVLATDTGGPLESVVDGTTGFLRHNTAPDFASAMSSIASDAQLARRMGQAGAARAQAQFSRQAFGAQLEAICEHALQV